jgi:hypothetical protein
VQLHAATLNESKKKDIKSVRRYSFSGQMSFSLKPPIVIKILFEDKLK